nr:hypothetical protein [Tanacetum cinerariifolium]
EQETTESGEGADEETESDGESKDEETTEKEDESFDLIPRTPKESKDDGNVTPIPLPQSTMTLSIMTTTTTASQLPIPPTPIPSLDLQNLPTFASVFRFEDRVKSLEVNFFNIPGIVHQYMHQQMPKAVREAVQIQTDRLQDSIQIENDEFLRTIDDNIKKIIKDQVKSQVKAQVIRILSRIEESVNAHLEAEVLTRSSHSSRTSYAMAADLSEMELKKILIDKMEGNKKPPTPDHDWNKSLTAAQGNANSWISVLAKQTDARSSFNELQDTPVDFSNFIMNRHGVDTLTPELLAGRSYELMRGLCNSLTELEYHLEEVYKAITDQLDWINPKGQQYPHNLLQPLPLIPDNRGRRVIPFEHFINNDLEYLRG